ncbi:MAG: hypothetical protein ABIT83_00500 [Massilia sp.]
MLKNMKLLALALPLLLAVASGSASAASVSNPDETGIGCNPVEYNDDNYYYNTYTWFAVPAMANGASVEVYGTSIHTDYWGQTYNYPGATFYCDNGVISTYTGYDFSVSWYLY